MTTNEKANARLTRGLLAKGMHASGIMTAYEKIALRHFAGIGATIATHSPEN